MGHKQPFVIVSLERLVSAKSDRSYADLPSHKSNMLVEFAGAIPELYRVKRILTL